MSLIRFLLANTGSSADRPRDPRIVGALTKNAATAGIAPTRILPTMTASRRLLALFPILIMTTTGSGVTRAATPQRPEADLCIVPPGAQPALPAKILPGMGDTNMPVTTTSEEARRFFNQGVSQIHSFWFVESERSFLQAATLDPDMAMAYWGISVSAASDYRPAFQLIRDPYDGGRDTSQATVKPQDIARSTNGAAIDGRIRAREAIARAMSLRDRVSARERLYIEAEAARRNPASSSIDADHIAGLRALIAAYPDDLQAKSMLGLALLDGYDPVSKAPRGHTAEGIRLLQEVVARDDSHFGAHHYLIHGWEGSRTPEQAWRHCQRYPELVTNIPHAIHMPGHIYAQSDRIDDAIAAFSAASTNELSWIEKDVLYPNGHHGHNMHFLVHTLNLNGRFRDSLARVRQIMDFKETPRERSGNNQRTPYRQGYYALVKTLVRFERWDLVLDGSTIPVYDKPEQQAWHTWALGLAHAARGRLDEARHDREEMRAHFTRATASRRSLEIALAELDATIAARSGDKMRGYELFRNAADMEASLIYTEPPSYPRPVVEGFAETAMALGDPLVAERAYREALAREPGSGRAYFGLATALQSMRKEDEARQMWALGRKAWDKADADLPQLAERSSSTGGAK
jgi:tetratricopeptide (TPR) repeat protein